MSRQKLKDLDFPYLAIQKYEATYKAEIALLQQSYQLLKKLRSKLYTVTYSIKSLAD